LRLSATTNVNLMNFAPSRTCAMLDFSRPHTPQRCKMNRFCTPIVGPLPGVLNSIQGSATT
jgi:hypothetical protein